MSKYIAVAQSILGNYNQNYRYETRTKLPHEYTTTIMYQGRHNTTSTKSRTMLAMSTQLLSGINPYHFSVTTYTNVPATLQ